MFVSLCVCVCVCVCMHSQYKNINAFIRLFVASVGKYNYYHFSSECDGLITQALLTANFEAAVEVCLSNNKLAEAVILAIAGGPELLARTQKKVFTRNAGNLNRVWRHSTLTSHIDKWDDNSI